MRRHCIETRCPNDAETGRPRCREHRLVYPYAERQRMAHTVDAWVEVYGWRCVGYGVPPHPSTDLTADHLVPRSRGGIGSQLTVLCRSCNARRGAHVR